MKRNPVFDREMKSGARNIRLPVILVLFNGILFLVTLLNMYSAVEQVRASSSLQYSSFIEIYKLVSSMEFLLLIFIAPAVTAASISGERERQTLDLMLTTQMTAAQVVTGKLFSALFVLLLLIFSGFPAIAMVFVYGGITWGDVVSIMMCYLAVALFAGSIGLCCSAFFKRSTISTVVTYGVLIAVLAGGYFINKFALSLSAMDISEAAAYVFGEPSAAPSSGGLFYLFLFNPAVTFFAILSGQAGGRPMTKMCSEFGMEYSGFVLEHWIPISILIQLVLAAALIAAAIWAVEPVKYKKHRKNKKLL
jgi:ABC-2 type transport system permease protein